LPYNPSQARALLAEAGFPEGKNFPLLSLLYNSNNMDKEVAIEIQAMWKNELGIAVILRAQEWKVYLNTMDQLDYDIARSSWVGDYPDPNTFLDCFVTGRGNNRTGWSNPTYDRLIEQANQMTDADKRFALMKNAETILVEQEVPIAPIYYYVGVALYDDKKIGGFHPNLIDEHPFEELYLKKQP
jgi:oligopeptide transport system substrate-binding protein